MKQIILILLLPYILITGCAKKESAENKLAKAVGGEIITTADIRLSLDASPDKAVVYKNKEGWFRLKICSMNDGLYSSVWEAPEILERPEITVTDIDQDKVDELYYIFKSGVQDKPEYSLFLYIPLRDRLLMVKTRPGNTGAQAEIIVEKDNKDYAVYNNYLIEKTKTINFNN
ncbi:MAG: hypothetical protein A2096_13220 [Spirochaetes bacterium GWF1_41_5]|nr:MAG: hypothetical protein A2096_13220 [Spirochaetes bacterium GWF1_41_5]HBE04316.1 hypothetical protein [Spirochaetia bacterium]